MIRDAKAVSPSRLVALLDGLQHDFFYAARSLVADPRVSIVASLTLTLGVAASTVMFSFVYSAVFQTLPYKDFQRLVVFKVQNLANAGGWKGREYFFADEVRTFREQNHVFEEVIAYELRRDYYNDGRFSRYLPPGAVVSANTFAFLGVQPQVGRGILQEDEKPSAPPVFVISYQLWESEFGSAPNLLGKVFLLGDRPTTLIGILPKHIEPLGASYWVPARADKSEPSLEGGARLMGRLKPGVALQATAADLTEIARRMQKGGPKGEFPEKFAIVPQFLVDTLIGNFKSTLSALLGAALLLLLIACSNVANLLLARATSRELEIAMRAAMGASRGRLMRQLLVESLLLAAIAAAAGCGLAFLVLKALMAVIPAGLLPSETVVRMSAPVLLVALGVTVLTALMCGLAPALHAAQSDLQPRLCGGGKGANKRGRSGRIRNVLVVSQVAFSVLLLVGAGLFMRSFLVLTRVDLGFDPKNIFYFRLDPTMYAQYRDYSERKARQNALTLQLLEKLRGLPGVKGVSESVQEPPLNYDWSDTIIPGRPHTERWETRFEICSEDYFRVLGVPLVQGRLFSEDDMLAARFVMVVNQAFANQYLSNENALGQRVKLGVLDRPFLGGPHDAYFEVVGVVRNYKTRGDNAWQDFPEVFIPYSVQAFSWRTFMARTEIDANLFLKTANQALSQIDPNVRIQKSGTVEAELQEYYRGPRFELVTLAAFASIGLMWVAIGVASVMAYAVSLRTQEIGVRMAIGAQRASITRLVLVGGLRLVAIGTVAGFAASLTLTRFLASQISGVSMTDPWTFSGVAAAIVAAATAACLFPARRAASIDPLEALRHQ